MTTNAAKNATAAMRKREQVMKTASEALLMSIQSIIAAGGDRASIDESVAQCKRFLEKNLAEADDGDEEVEIEDDGDDDGTSDHAVSLLADLLVESGAHADRKSAIAWLLGHKDGVATARRHKSGDTMSTEKIVKEFKRKRLAELEAMPITKVAATALAAPNENILAIDESEFTALVTKAAQKAHPSLSAASAFSKLFTEQSDRGALIRKAHKVIKEMASLEPTQVGGEDARDVHPGEAGNAAYEKLMELAEKQRATAPYLSTAQAFARVVKHPTNRELASRALQPPPKDGFYGYPGARRAAG
jgi:hypothetical protein